MALGRDKTGKILWGLAALAFVPQQLMSADMKRLPPVDPPHTEVAPAKLLPAPKASAVRNGISHSIWLQEDQPSAAGVGRGASGVKLINWDDESFVPPVQIEMDSPEELTPAVAKPSLQPFMKLASQQPASSAAGQTVKHVVKPVAGLALALPTQAVEESTADQPATAEEPVQPGAAAIDDPCEYFDDSELYGTPLPPCWYLQADALMLFRSDVRTIKIVEHGTGAAVRGQRPALLTTDELDPNPTWGPRFTLGHYLNDIRNLELVYFGLHHWASQAAFNGINGVGFSFNNIDVPFDSNLTSDFDGGQYVSGDYASKINNFEVNLVTNNRWDLMTSTGFPWYHYVDFLAGFRYFRLSEEFDLRSTDAGETSDYLIDTVNDLLGGQVGMVVGTYNTPNLSWNMAAKAGVFANFARQSTLMRDNNNTVLFRDFTTEGRELAFVGDFNFQLAYDLRPNMSVTAGYYLLYVGGVALAPEQLDFTTTPTSGSGINVNGGAFYHGPSVGLRINY